MFGIFKNKAFSTSILGINERNVNYVYAHNPRKKFPLADDKVLCKEVLHRENIACAETYGVIKRVGDIQAVWSSLQHHDSLAIKPAMGSGGGGIIILKKKDGQWTKSGKPFSEEQIYATFARILMGMYSFGSSDKVLIEQCIESHPFFHEIYPAGVPDFRIILFKNKPIMGMLRVPTDRSDGKANLHQGGLGIGINLRMGCLTTAFDGKDYHLTHPDNGNKIAGKKIPCREELIDLSIATSKAFPLDYLGIDIVLDKTYGPMVMEINVRPGLGIQLANQKGLKELLVEIES